MASVRLKHAISVIRPFLADNLRGKSRYVKRLGLDHYKTCLCECTCVLHTSVSTWKGKQFKVKYVEPKKKAPTVKVWTNMTAEELAAATQRDIDVIWDALELTKNREGLRNARSVLQNVTMVCSACKLLGYRGVIGAPPNLCVTEEQEDKDVRKRPPSDPKDLVKRPPVVTIMGHVDHGKTTLLDTLRHTSVVQNEFGGITQHIGAFTVNVNQKEKVTFLDTPGHAAFSAMRARGAYVTDIVVLVVAADDGVMEQTVESIRYARDANVSIIVAVNKMDKPNLDIERVKSELIAQDLQIEDIGGDVQLVYISAKTGLNVEQLIEAILVQAEVMEIKGDPKGLVEGAILESSTDTARGKLATVLVQRGTLKKGDYLVSGTAWAKVRILIDEWGKPVQLAPPGTPVQVLGWKELPSAGEEILQVKTEKEAKEVVAWRQKKEDESKQMADLPAINQKREEHLVQYRKLLEEKRMLGRRYRIKIPNYQKPKEIVEDTHPRLSIVIKGDVDGSLEAILDVINTYHHNDACTLDVIHFDVGPVSENDVELAEAFKGIVYTFNVKPLSGIPEMAEEKNVRIKEFNVIYKLVDDLKIELGQKLPFSDEEEIVGEANVLQEFLVSEGRKKVPVAGCKCTKGVLKKKGLFRLERNGEKIHDGPLASIRHLKNEVELIKKETECGLRFENRSITFQPGDVVICYVINKVPQKTAWKPPGF